MHEMRRNCTRRGIEMPTRVRPEMFPCFMGLVMGDINAADFCAEAHARVLRKAGSLDHGRSMCNGRPMPRGGALEGLVIDDHIGIAVDPPGSAANAELLQASFDAAATAYAGVNLKTSAT